LAVSICCLNIDVFGSARGGVDYEVFGKTGYDLAKNMRFNDPNNQFQQQHRVPLVAATASTAVFDSFQCRATNKKRRSSTVKWTKAIASTAVELLAIAAAATQTHWVLYDVPRNESHFVGAVGVGGEVSR
jgi:hypothetical protein